MLPSAFMKKYFPGNPNFIFFNDFWVSEFKRVKYQITSFPMKKYGKLYGIMALAVLFQACGETGIPDPDPKPSPGVDFTININQSPYTALQNTGGSATNTQNKVIIARLSTSTWAALSSTCPNDGVSPITFNSGNQTFRCAADNTVFDVTGKVTSGSSKNLTKYETTFSVNSGELRIYEN